MTESYLEKRKRIFKEQNKIKGYDSQRISKQIKKEGKVKWQ